MLRRRGETVDRGEVCVGVERCGLEGFRKGGEDFIYLFFFFQRERERELDSWGYRMNENENLSDKFYFSVEMINGRFEISRR